MTAQELAAAVETHGSQRAAARALGLAETTFRRRLEGVRPHQLDRLSDHAEPEEIPVIVRDYSHLDYLRVYPLGDVHKGASHHLTHRWREWVKYLVDTPNTSMLGTGDFYNAALKTSKSESYDEVLTVGEAKRELRAELRPLAERIDVLLPGNHEDRIYRAVGDCPVHDLADSLEVPYAPASAFVIYLVGDQEYRFYVRHGTGNGQGLTQLQKGALVARADVYVTGHTHKLAVTADECFDVEDGRSVRHRRYYVSSASFLGYERYAAERGYPPTRIGAARIHLDGQYKDVHVSI